MNLDAIIGQFLFAAKDDAVWGRFDHGRPGVGAAEWSLMIGGTVLLLVVIAVSYWRSKREKAEFVHDSPSLLFNELSRAHRLDRRKRRLIKKLAVEKGVEPALTLFVEPDYFEEAKLPESLKSSARDLRLLRHELFEE